MDAREREFIRQWIDDSIHAEPFVDEEDDDLRPTQYAKACQVEAEAEGISLGDPEELGNYLESQMIDAINASAEAEIDRLASKDD